MLVSGKTEDYINQMQANPMTKLSWRTEFRIEEVNYFSQVLSFSIYSLMFIEANIEVLGSIIMIEVK